MTYGNLDLKELIRTIPDYPKAGIMFRDITTLIGHAQGFRSSIRRLAEPFEDMKVDEIGRAHV
jgi:adenine phosphoribosyltransferase